MNERKGLCKLNEDGPPPVSIAADILGALADFTDALEKGEVTTRFTCRQIKLDLQPEQYDPALVKRTRKLLRLSQPLFAQFLGVSTKTVRAWEQGRNVPPRMACRFMDEIRRKPDYWLDRLRDAMSACADPSA